MIGAGAATGGIIGALTKLGISTEDAHLYVDHIHRGSVLIIARTADMHTMDIFKKNDGKDVEEYNIA